MKKNLGTADRIIRLFLAAAFGILILTGQVAGAAAVILGILAVVLLGTSVVSFCPLYFPFNFSTRKTEGTEGK
jgi:hypothetical protein